MAHVAKYNSNACGHLFKHYEREKNEQGEYIKFGNENIDTSKSHLNYNLAEDKNQFEFLKQRTSEVKCLKRKDVNVMCSWVVTKPKDLPEALEEKFFKDTYKFLEFRYGSKNIISAHVHMDEVTPHMHFSFVPVTLDKKKDIEKVSAKEVINKKDLMTFHKDLEKHLELGFGYNVGILNEQTREGNKSIEELKRVSATERLSKANKEVASIKDTLKPLKAEYEAKKAFIKQAEKDSDVSVMYPSYAEVKKKGLFSKDEFVTVPKDKWEKKHVAANFVNSVNKECEALEQEMKEFYQDVPSIRELQDEIFSLKKELKTKDHRIKSMEHIVKSSPELRDAYNKQAGILRDEKQRQKQIKRPKSFDIER